MTRGFSKFMTAAFALVLLGGVATPVVAQADDATNSVAVTKQAKSENAIKVSTIETPYAYFSTTSGITKLPMLTGWPESLTVAQLQDDDYMQKMMATHPVGNTIDVNGIRDQMLALAAQVSSYNLQDSYLTNLLNAENIPMSETDYANMMAPTTIISLWMVKMVLSTRQTGVMNQEAMAQDYAENIIPELKRLNASEAVINADNPGKFSAESFETYIWPVFQNKCDQVLAQVPALGELSLEEIHKINPVESTNEQLKRLLAPMSNYLTKLSDGSYKLSGGTLFMFTFISTGLPPEVTPAPTPTPAKSQPVTVHYVDDQGNQLAKDRTLAGDLNAAYHSDALTFTGYKLTQTPTNATGKFTTQPQSVTYVYSKEATL